MEAVGNLNCIGRALPRAFGERAGTITRDHLNAGMISATRKRGLSHWHRAVTPWAIGAEVDQDGFEIQAFAIGPFVHTLGARESARSTSCVRRTEAQNGGWLIGIP